MKESGYSPMYYRLEFLIIKMAEALKSSSKLFTPGTVGFAPSISRRDKYFRKESGKEYKIRTGSDRFLSLFIISITVHRLVRESRTITKRAIYYLHPGLFKTQQQSCRAAR